MMVRELMRSDGERSVESWNPSMEKMLIVSAMTWIEPCSSCDDQQDGLWASGLDMREESNCMCLDTDRHGMLL
jgi:hypothetical protein